MTKNCIYCGIPADTMGTPSILLCIGNPRGRDHVFDLIDHRPECAKVRLDVTHEYTCGLDTKKETTLEPVAKRDPVSFRFDILDPEFLQALAAIADYGAKKYGDLNWHKSRLTGDKSPVNHMFKHLLQYQGEMKYDHPEIGSERKLHLAAVAFNAMMEFWYECHPEVK